jgi:hypothetical protein
VYLALGGPDISRFERSTGALVWNHQEGTGGGGGTAVYAESRVFVRDQAHTPAGFTLDSQTGALLSRFDAMHPPAVADGRAFFWRWSGTSNFLEARSVSSGAQLWTFGGDGQIGNPSIVINQQVYIGSGAGNLYVLDAATGQQVWTTNVGAPIVSGQEYMVPTGLAVGDGVLVVPAGNSLVAFGPSSGAATPTVTPTPTATSTPTPTVTSTPTPPPRTLTITFDDLSAPSRPLSGEYPSGVIDWGTDVWFLSGPYGRWSTNSVSFNGAGPTSAAFALLSSWRLVQLDAYNGGAAASTITLSCVGFDQTPIQRILDAGQMVTIPTGWLGVCSGVALTSSNGWDTNFKNLVLTAP